MPQSGNNLAGKRAADVLCRAVPGLRIPVIPGYSDTAEYMERAAALTAALRAESVMLLPFHRLGAPKYRALGLEYEYQTVPGVERSLLERLSRAFRWQTVKF